jgi:hypothetical protein
VNRLVRPQTPVDGVMREIVRLADDLRDVAIDAARLQDIHAHAVMQRHQLGLVGTELAGLEQDVVGNADLPDIVQQRRNLQQLQVPGLPAQMLRDADRQLCHAPRMGDGRRVTKVQGSQQLSQHLRRDDPFQRLEAKRILRRDPRQVHQPHQDARRIGRRSTLGRNLGKTKRIQNL